MRTPSRRLAALFLAALLGIAAVVGIVVAEAAGRWALLVWVVAVAAAFVVVGVASVRRVAAPATPRRACACCDGDHLAPARSV